MINVRENLGIQDTYLTISNITYTMQNIHIILKGKILKIFPLTCSTRGFPVCSVLFKTGIKVVTRTMKNNGYTVEAY